MSLKVTRRQALKGALATGTLLAGARINIGRAQSGPLRIGVMYALSGPGAPVGEVLLAGTRIAADQVNKAGGLDGRQIELVVRDDKYNGAAAVAAAQELAGDGINLMIGGSQTVMALGIIPLLPEMKAVMVSPAAAGLAITHELFNKHIFRTTSNVYTQYRAMAQALINKHPGVTSWSLVVPEGEYGQGLANFFSAAVKEFVPAANNGAEGTMNEPIFVSVTGTDFRVPINTAMSSSAEGLMLGIVGAPQVSFLQQARSVGLYEKMKVIGDAGNEAVLGRALGRNLPPNIWSVSYGSTMLDPLKSNPLAQKLQTDYEASSGMKGPPPGILLAGHRGAHALFEGIKKAGSTETDAVIAAMEGLTFDTPGGPYSIRAEDHQGLGTNYYVKMTPSDSDPFFVIDEQIGVAEAEVVEPATPGMKFNPG